MVNREIMWDSTLVETFDGGLMEFYKEAERNTEAVRAVMADKKAKGRFYDDHNPIELSPRTLKGVQGKLSRNDVPTVLDIATEAVKASTELKDVMTFKPTWDVAGDFVDVGRFCMGEPECMVTSPIRPNTTVSRVITLVSSADSNVGGEWKTRGIIATALGLALDRLGYSTEMWADNYGESYGSYPSPKQYQRILVKGTADTIDPSKLLFGFGDKVMLTELAFGNYDGFALNPDWADRFSGFWQYGGRGGARERTRQIESLYPDGTIFITGYLYGGADPATVAKHIAGELKKIGILPS